MNDLLSFNITKLEEIIEKVREAYTKYKQDLATLEMQIKHLDEIWGSSNQSVWTEFKEKYEEKKSKLLNAENMMNELLNELIVKQEQLRESTINARNSFE